MRRGWTWIAVTAAVALIGAAAGSCYKTPTPACAFLCGQDGVCPSGYQCRSDGWCKRSDVADDFVCQANTAPDAAVADAMPADAAATDAALTDAAPTDATTTDAAPGDAMPGDAAPLDAAPLDAAPLDAAPPDGAPLDATPPVDATPLKDGHGRPG